MVKSINLRKDRNIGPRGWKRRGGKKTIRKKEENLIAKKQGEKERLGEGTGCNGVK